MKYFKLWYVRVIAFLLGFLLLNQCVELAFLNVDTGNLVSMTDMRQEESADMYFIGSSWFRGQINSTMITEESGVDCFTLASEAIEIPSQKIFLEEIFKTKHPKYVVIDYDVRSYIEPLKEAPIVLAYMWPELSLDTRVKSAVTASQEDGLWLDHVFPWRYYTPKTIRNVGGNVAKKLLPQLFRDHYAETMSPQNPEAQSHYTGKGHFGLLLPHPEDYAYRYASAYKTMPEATLNETTASGFLELKAMCEDHDCQMIILGVPFHRAQVLSNEAFFKGSRALEEFCETNDIVLWNFMYATEELMPVLDAYYYDDTHLNAEGAELFSHSLARVVKLFAEGQDVSDLFCDEAGYRASVDGILNTYYMASPLEDAVEYTAYVNAGSAVTPQYQFALVSADGREQIVQPYSEVRTCTLTRAETEGKQVRVYAMNAAAPDQPVCSYTK